MDPEGLIDCKNIFACVQFMCRYNEQNEYFKGNFKIFDKSIVTISWIKMFVMVKNCVTRIAHLPGIAVRGMMKLKNDVITIAKHGM